MNLFTSQVRQALKTSWAVEPVGTESGTFAYSSRSARVSRDRSFAMPGMNVALIESSSTPNAAQRSPTTGSEADSPQTATGMPFAWPAATVIFTSVRMAGFRG